MSEHSKSKKTMKKESLQVLGKCFHDWYVADKVQFIYEASGQDLEMEVARISELIQYVKNKRKQLLAEGGASLE